MKRLKERKRKWTAGRHLAWMAGAASLLGLIALYETYLPPVRKRKSSRYPYSLLLGCAADDDGLPSRAQLGRCELAIEAWRRGDYETLVISGSAVKNQFVEAQVMADLIHSLEPELPILKEEKARNTWENLKFTRDLIGDVPVEVITGSLHARRASAITRNFFSDYAVIGCPDFTWKKFLREIASRIQYCTIEIQKKLDQPRN